MFSVTLAFFIFVFALLLACIISALTKIVSAKTALICGAVVLLGAGASVFIPEVREYFNIPTVTPDYVAERFVRELSEGDISALSEFYPGAYDMEYEPENETEELFCGIILDSYDCSLDGEYELGFDGSEQNITVSHVDIRAYCDDVCTLASQKLEKAGAEELRSLVYESDKTYKESVVREAFLSAAKEIGKTDKYTVTDSAGLRIISVEGKWYVDVTESLVHALHCGLGEGSMKTLVSQLIEENIRRLRIETPYVYKHYSIEGDYSTLTPAPDPDGFGVTDDPAVVQAVVDSAANLLAGQQLAWNVQREIMPGSDIHYYCDESILVIVWREVQFDSVCTYAEIKLSDPSQLRRKLTGDAYGSNIWTIGSELAAETNCVLATGGDLYAFRDLGITSYEGELYRCLPKYVDSCHFTRDGNMLFSYKGELMDEQEAQQFIADNDVRFSVAFGPVLIDGGQVIPVTDYIIGEISEEYCRSCIGMLDELHYVQIVMSRDGDYQHNVTLKQAQDIMVGLGCRDAYTLDGGQTGLVVINGEVINRPTYGYERVMSDLICYATAVPENDRLKSVG